MEVEEIECSPHEIILDVASLMRVMADKKGLALEVEYNGPIPNRIHSDPTRLRQILINLVGNAIKFTEDGTVRVVASLLRADSDSPELQFDVTDTGIGMSPTERSASMLDVTIIYPSRSVARN
ncbi:MAG: ATP-binding protein [Pirellulaceae bacterium]